MHSGASCANARQCRLECTGAHRGLYHISKFLTCSPARMTAQPCDVHSASGVQPRISLIRLQGGHENSSSLLVQGELLKSMLLTVAMPAVCRWVSFT